MPLGLALISVKKIVPANYLKGFLDSSYPKEFNISRGLIQKIVKIIHADEENGIIEVKYGDKIILVNSKKNLELDQKELVVLILSHEEINSIDEYYDLLVEKLKKFYLKSKQDRILKFSNFAKDFYKSQSSKKLLFIGFPSAGKTSIKRAFFDGISPSILLGNEAPEPTRGLAHFVYSWLDAEVGIVDSSGQEFESYVSANNSFERMLAFEESDIILYVFDVENWKNNNKEVIENLQKIINARDSTASNAKIYTICHKIDLLQGSNKEKAKSFLKIKEIIEKKFEIKTIFTSIIPELIHTLFRSMQILLNDLSNLGNSIEEFCAEVIKNQQKSAVFLLNDRNNVISQKSTADLDIDEVSNVIKLVKNQQKVLKESPEFGELDYSVIHTKNDMALIVKSINIIKYGVSTVAFLSQSVNKQTLSKLIETLDKRLNFEKRTSVQMKMKKE